MNKRAKENLGFLLLGALSTFLFMELHFLKQGTRIDNQAEIINAYDQYWHAVEDKDMLQVIDRFDYYDPLVINYYKVRENLVKVTNRYESNPNHIHK